MPDEWRPHHSRLPGEPAVQPAVGCEETLQQQVAAGDWSEVGTGTIDGRTAIELSSNVLGNGELWVSTRTYLPSVKSSPQR